jgi:hypothetical protein
MSAPGWYPDPGGVPNLYRYWDGRAWTNQLTPQPGGPPPNAPGQHSSAGQPPTPDRDGRPGLPPAKRSGRGWLIALIAVAVAVVVVVVLAVRGLSGTLGGLPGGPGGDPSANVCPTPEANSSPTLQPNDGRVHSGPLSYPMLPSPWEAPAPPEEGVPFGRDVLQQFVETEQTPSLRWGAAVMVGELVAGDGFFAPKDGAEIVLRCVTGTFYGDAEVTRNDTRSQAMTVDGHDAWLMESDLSFSIPGLEATNELLTVVIVDLKNGSAGLFASSVPGNTPQYNEPARQAMEGLRVD